MRFYFFTFSITVLTTLALKPLYAQIPRTLSHQGVLTDSNGELKPDDEYKFTFRLYDLESGGSPIWEEKEKTLSVKKGLFSTILGDQTPFGSSVRFDKPYWLSIQIKREGEQEEQLSPRIPLTSVGYSFGAVWADTAMVSITSVGDTTWQTNGSDIYRPNGNVGIGYHTPQAKLDVNTGGPNRFAAEGIFGKAEHNLFLDTAGWQNAATISGRHGVTAGDIVSTGLVLNSFYGASSRAGASIKIDAKRGDGDITFFTGNSTSNPIQRARLHSGGLHVNGRTTTKVLEITGGSDLAEPFEISDNSELAPGTVVVIDPENPGQLKQATEPYDKKVAGVISGAGGVNPGLTLTQEGVLDGGQHVALTGKVYSLATAANGAIEPGDLLTTSGIPGHAMKVTDAVRSNGAIIGKAMSSLHEGEGLGLVLVLVNLQ